MLKKFIITSLSVSALFLNSCKKKDDGAAPINQAPTGTIEDAGWSGSYLKVKVTYADKDGTVQKVQLRIYKDGSFYSDGFPYTTNQASGSITFANVIDGFAKGKYEIYADITDNAGATTRTSALEENIL